jgi:uncharacterized protein YoxC
MTTSPSPHSPDLLSGSVPTDWAMSNIEGSPGTPGLESIPEEEDGSQKELIESTAELDGETALSVAGTYGFSSVGEVIRAPLPTTLVDLIGAKISTVDEIPVQIDTKITTDTHVLSTSGVSSLPLRKGPLKARSPKSPRAFETTRTSSVRSPTMIGTNPVGSDLMTKLAHILDSINEIKGDIRNVSNRVEAVEKSVLDMGKTIEDFRGDLDTNRSRINGAMATSVGELAGMKREMEKERSETNKLHNRMSSTVAYLQGQVKGLMTKSASAVEMTTLETFSPQDEVQSSSDVEGETRDHEDTQKSQMSMFSDRTEIAIPLRRKMDKRLDDLLV